MSPLSVLSGTLPRLRHLLCSFADASPASGGAAGSAVCATGEQGVSPGTEEPPFRAACREEAQNSPRPMRRRVRQLTYSGELRHHAL